MSNENRTEIFAVGNALDNTVTKLRANDGMTLGTFSVGEEKEDGWVISVYRIKCDDVQEVE